MSKIFAKHMEAIKEAETFIANNIGLDTVSLLVEYGRSKYVTGRDSGFRKILFKTVNEKEDPLKPQRIFEITEGGYVKHHNEVGIAIEETLHGWKVMLPSGLYTEVNEKDLTAISSAEFVEAVKPSRFVTQFEK
jgi:hypothetical protein